MKRIDLVVTIHLPPPFPLLSRMGTGCCSKCATLTRNAEDAVKAMGINASVEEVTDIEKIISYGIMRTPALAVVETNGRNVCGSIAIFISIRILASLLVVLVRISVFGRYFGRIFCVFDTNFGIIPYFCTGY